MPSLPDALGDVHFGVANAPLPTWRDHDEVARDLDPDDEQLETPADVVDILGFDPAKET